MLKQKITGLAEARARLGARARQLPYALSRAMNTTVLKGRSEINQTMSGTFQGGATPWTLKAFEVLRADKRNLSAAVRLRIDGGAGKSRGADETIGHLFTGGSRTFKKSEYALQQAGILPPGMIMVVPATASWANPLDVFGNPKRSLIVRLIAYLGAFSEQGYRANMKDRSKARLAKRGRTEAGSATINGVVYFVSRGRGEFTGRGSWRNGRQQHLPRGIWAKRSIHGFDVAPVFLFVRKDTYRRKVDIPLIGRAVVARYLRSEFIRELAAALASAR